MADLGTWQWSLESDWYKQQATLALRLACSAPGPPVDSMAELANLAAAIAAAWTAPWPSARPT